MRSAIAVIGLCAAVVTATGCARSPCFSAGRQRKSCQLAHQTPQQNFEDDDER